MRKKQLFIQLIVFVSSILSFCLSIILILNFTVLNEKYVKNALNEVEYYESVYEKAKVSINNVLNYSGVYDIDIEKIVSVDDTKNDINNYIDLLYSSEIHTVNYKQMENRINEQINEYINTHKVKVNDKITIEEIIDECINAYQEKISNYGYINKNIYALKQNVYLIFGIDVLLLAVSIIFLLKNKCENMGAIFISNSLLLLISVLITKYSINYEEILILSREFSNFLVSIINNILKILKNVIAVSLIVGISIICLQNLSKKDCKKEKKRVK